MSALQLDGLAEMLFGEAVIGLAELRLALAARSAALMSLCRRRIDVVSVVSTPLVVQPPIIKAAAIAAIAVRNSVTHCPCPDRPFAGSFLGSNISTEGD